MCPRSFLCEEAKIKQRTPSKKELCEIGEEAIRASISFCRYQLFEYRANLKSQEHNFSLLTVKSIVCYSWHLH